MTRNLNLTPEPRKDGAGAPSLVSPDAFQIYVAEAPGMALSNLTKIGSVLTADPTDIVERMNGLKSAMCLYHPIPVGVVAVKPLKRAGRVKTEQLVGCHLTNSGLTKSGEIYFGPGRCAKEIFGGVLKALTIMERAFEVVDVSDIAEHFRNKNRSILANMKGARPDPGTCPYAAFRLAYASPLPILEGGDSGTMARLNELATLGYLVSDLAIGACSGPINFSPDEISDVIVYPPSSLDQAFFEARSEQALVLPIMGRTEVRVNDPERISERPLSMSLFHDHVLGFEIPGPFQPPAAAGGTLWRFSAEHLAVLGDRAVVTEVDDFYPGSHARAPLPSEVFAVAREHPDWLPCLRFWVGIVAAWKRNIRLQDYVFPTLPKQAHKHLARTATVIQNIGLPLTNDLVAWVRNDWI